MFCVALGMRAASGETWFPTHLLIWTYFIGTLRKVSLFVSFRCKGTGSERLSDLPPSDRLMNNTHVTVSLQTHRTSKSGAFPLQSGSAWWRNVFSFSSPVTPAFQYHPDCTDVVPPYRSYALVRVDYVLLSCSFPCNFYFSTWIRWYSHCPPAESSLFADKVFQMWFF